MSLFQLDSASVPPPAAATIKRRAFFRYAGATASAATLALVGCNKDGATPGATDVGNGDIGVLNFAFAIEQIEAAFYAKVLTGDYFTKLATNSADYQIFSDLARHEQLHVDFLRTVLSTSALKVLTINLDDQINFDARLTTAGSSKMGVLNAARMFEDLGVAAYNGAAPFLTTGDYLLLIGKIVSVEARHAALIRDLLVAKGDTTLGTGFVGADVVDSKTRQEITITPANVLAKINTFLGADSQLTASKLA
ncbi:MAG: ferritin-like domain-containing protein [Janthinobacterium lividum]